MNHVPVNIRDLLQRHNDLIDVYYCQFTISLLECTVIFFYRLGYKRSKFVCILGRTNKKFKDETTKRRINY